jgi:hypothetical protein
VTKRTLAAIVAVLALASLASGQIAATVLDIDPGVRALGVGGAAVSLAEGAETLYYNPAGLARLSGISLTSSYASHLGLGNYGALGLAFKNWGIGVLNFGSGDIGGYDDEGNPTGTTLSYGSTAFLMAFGLSPSQLPFLPALPFDFSVGMRFKYLTGNIGETGGSGFAVDLSYWMAFPDMRFGPIALSDLSLGVAANELLGSISFGAESESLGMGLVVGASARVAGAVLVALDLDLARQGVRLGAEYQPIPALAVRAGILARPVGMTVTLGLGMSIEGIQIDYAFASHPFLGGSHRISLAIDFTGFDLAAIGRNLRNLIR